MSSISYTATEKIVRADLDVSNTDISIAAIDDSFNSVSSNLSGMLANEWVLVSGSAADDGWHQLNADSTATKIETISALTDEAAGSVISIAGYKHGLNESYSFDFPAMKLDDSYVPKSKGNPSLSGIVETLFFNEAEFWDVTAGIIFESEMPYWLEFFASVRAGGSFGFDPYGTVAAPDNAKTCILVGGKFDKVRVGPGKYTLSFKVRVQ